jgi:transposase
MNEFQRTSRQRTRLEDQLHNTKDVGVFRRTLAVLEVARGRSLAEVARLLRTSRVSIYHWLERYQQEDDPADLFDQRGGNNPTVWTDELPTLLQASLSYRPNHFGYSALNWTVDLLAEHLTRRGGRPVSATTVRRQLHRLDYVWKRPRYVLVPDPEREKKRHIRRKIQHLPPRTVKLFEDETDLLLFPPLRGAWGQKGQPIQVPLSGRNARRVVFGTINLVTGHRLFWACRHQRGVDFQEFLEVIRWHYRGWAVALVLDEDPSHTAAESQMLAHSLEIELVGLPKRCPELNGMDQLWGHGKDHQCANWQYAGIDEGVDAFICYLLGLSNTEARLQAGILSDDFWLKNVV